MTVHAHVAAIFAGIEIIAVFLALLIYCRPLLHPQLGMEKAGIAMSETIMSAPICTLQ